MNGMVGDMIFLEVLTPVENRSKMNIKITSIDLDLNINEKYIGKLTNIDDIAIPKHSNEIYLVRLKLKIEGFFGILSAANLLSSQKKTIHITGQIKAKSKGVIKIIEVDQVIEQ